MIRRHKRFIWVEKGEDDSESTNEELENADLDCTLRASTCQEEKKEAPRRTQMIHGRTVPVNQTEDEVPQ